MTTSGRAELRAQIATAFLDVPALPAGEIASEQHRDNIEVQEMAGTFGGRHWTELSLQELFYHRESVFALSSAGYLSYLPAYLAGCLHGDARLGTDLIWYTVGALRTQRKQRTTSQRLELFNAAQRAAVAAVLRHLAERFDDERAAQVLAEWARPGDLP